MRKIGELKRGGRSLAEIKRALNERVARARDNDVDLVAQESDRVRAAIIQAATEEFMAKGYRRTHVDTIIQQLGINAQLFYKHFPSKLHLLAECFQTFMKGSVAQVEGEIAPCSDPGERALRRLAAGFRTNDLGPILSAAIRSEGRFDEFEEYHLEDTLGVIVGEVAKDIAAARTQGPATPPVSDELLAYGLLGAHRYQNMRTSWGRGLTTADFLRSHLFHHLAVLAAASGEVDIYGRLAHYEDLIQELSALMPELPSTFES